MKHKDTLYGDWELPVFIKRLVTTKEMVRLRNITQAVLPNDFMPYGPIPSRFQHGLGVARLSMAVLENNPQLSDFNVLLPVAALLHDAGNPPLSHLGEHFLKEITGYDGESFLSVLLDGSETEKILREYGISIEQVTALVTGKAKPLSEVLNGSMDIDNLDNVGRYNLAADLGAEKFDAVKIASSFRLDSDKSELFLLDRDGVWKETQKWKTARGVVYASIYGMPHLVVAMMVYRATEIAFYENELSMDFFLLNDYEAITYLLTKCNLRTKLLVERARRWNWYEEVVAIETTTPSARFKELAFDWKGRKYLADKLCEQFGREPDEICVYVGKGRDKRKITLPFISDFGEKRFDVADNEPIYRAKIWIPRDVSIDKVQLKGSLDELLV